MVPMLHVRNENTTFDGLTDIITPRVEMVGRSNQNGQPKSTHTPVTIIQKGDLVGSNLEPSHLAALSTSVLNHFADEKYEPHVEDGSEASSQVFLPMEKTPIRAGSPEECHF